MPANDGSSWSKKGYGIRDLARFLQRLGGDVVVRQQIPLANVAQTPHVEIAARESIAGYTCQESRVATCRDRKRLGGTPWVFGRDREQQQVPSSCWPLDSPCRFEQRVPFPLVRLGAVPGRRQWLAVPKRHRNAFARGRLSGK